MKPQIVADSSLETNESIAREVDPLYVPFAISLGETHYVDDGSTTQQTFIEAMKAYPHSPKSAAPTPGQYAEAFREAAESFAVCLSSKLSASYANAVLAARLVSEEAEKRKIHVFDSKSAVCGESLVGLRLSRWIAESLPFEEIVEKTEEFIEGMRTFFVLESLENLVKNGRIGRIKGAVASALSMMPVMRATDGNIEMHEMARGKKNAHKKLLQTIEHFAVDPQRDTIVISHCQSPEVAQRLAEEVAALKRFRRIEITGMNLLSSMYANRGGIVVSF